MYVGYDKKRNYTITESYSLNIYSNKITEMKHINYWERLHKLKLYSLWGRGERYIIIHIWKIT